MMMNPVKTIDERGGKMFPKAGRKLPGRSATDAAYALRLAETLRGELGSTHRAHKTLMRWTGAKERTTKNWLAGANCPSGGHLLRLIQNSDRILECVLELTDRKQILPKRRLIEIQSALQQTAELLAEILEAEMPPHH